MDVQAALEVFLGAIWTVKRGECVLIELAFADCVSWPLTMNCVCLAAIHRTLRGRAGTTRVLRLREHHLDVYQSAGGRGEASPAACRSVPPLALVAQK